MLEALLVGAIAGVIVFMAMNTYHNLSRAKALRQYIAKWQTQLLNERQEYEISKKEWEQQNAKS